MNINKWTVQVEDVPDSVQCVECEYAKHAAEYYVEQNAIREGEVVIVWCASVSYRYRVRTATRYMLTREP